MADTNTTPIEINSDRKTQLGDVLRRRILNMDLKPGSVVDELAISTEFGLSRPPVRELLRQMAAEGYIELEPNRAPRVSVMTYDSLRSFFLAAPLIYVATTQLATHTAVQSDIEALKVIQENFRRAIESGDTEGRVIHNDEFHFEIGKIAANTYLLPSLKRVLIDHARLGKIFYRAASPADMQKDLATAVDQHDRIIEAIEQRDADTAGEVVRAHMDLSRRRMTEYTMPTGLDIPIRF